MTRSQLFWKTFRIFLALVLVQYILFHLTGCMSMEQLTKRSEYECPQVVWKYLPTADRDSEYDWFHEQSARRGCVKYYGEGACLVSMTKTGKDSFYAMCRRKTPDVSH